MKYPLSNMNFYSNLSLLRWFIKGMMTSLYSSSSYFQIDNIVKNKKNHRKSENSE